MKIIVTGATGFIGSHLVPALRDRGDQVVVLARDAARAKQELGDVEAVTADLQSKGAWWEALSGVDAIIHLAGEPLAGKRWDARQKQKVRDSRVESTRTIVEAISMADPRPRALITASGVDYYPAELTETDWDDDEYAEKEPAGTTFLARLCRDWEHEALEAEKLGVRVVCMRTGLVLGKGGGAVSEMKRPFKLFAGGRLGSGRQWMAWIHLDDVVAGYIAAATDERYKGPINLVAGSTRNYDFARELGKAMHRPAWMPVPAFAIKAAVGAEFAESVLKGRRVVPAKLRELGFAWKYPTLDGALAASV